MRVSPRVSAALRAGRPRSQDEKLQALHVRQLARERRGQQASAPRATH